MCSSFVLYFVYRRIPVPACVEPFVVSVCRSVSEKSFSFCSIVLSPLGGEEAPRWLLFLCKTEKNKKTSLGAFSSRSMVYVLRGKEVHPWILLCVRYTLAIQ